jgi:hypothetical protein
VQNKGLKDDIQSLQARQQELVEKLATLEANEIKVKEIV